MSDLIISVFDEEFRAEEVRTDLLKRGKKHLADLGDAVVIRRASTGRVRLHHCSHLMLEGIVGGGFLGSLVGIILLNPVFALFGLATGAIAGAVSGSMTHLGVKEEFVRELAEHLKPGTSALCILVSQNMERILEEIAAYGGRVLWSSLLHEDEARLLEAVESMRSEAGYGLAHRDRLVNPVHDRI